MDYKMTRTNLRLFASMLTVSALATGLALGGCTARVATDDGLVDRKLHGFDSCEDLLSYARGHAKQLLDAGMYHGYGGGWYGGGVDGDFPAEPGLDDGGTPLPPDSGSDAGGDDGGEGSGGDGDGLPDYSGTNVQELGIDEPDVVKTDGERIYAIAQGRLQIVDITDGAPVLLGSLDLSTADYAGDYGERTDMFLQGDRLLLMSHAWLSEDMAANYPPEWDSTYYGLRIARFAEIDLSNPASPEVIRTLHVGGSTLSARMVDGVVRIVIRSQPQGLDIKGPWDFMEDGGYYPYPGDPGVDGGSEPGGSDSGGGSVPPDGGVDEPEPTPDPIDPDDTSGSDTSDGTGDEPLPPDDGTDGGGVDGTDGGGIDGTDGGGTDDGKTYEEAWAEAVEKAKAHNEAVLDASTERNWLPLYVLEDFSGAEPQVTSGLLYGCESALRPGIESGIEVLSVVNIDLAEGAGVLGGTGVFATGEVVYGSGDRMYVATMPWWSSVFGAQVAEDVDSDGTIEPEPQLEGAYYTTYVHAFDVADAAAPTYRASGSVRGRVLNQFSMSEFDGTFRIATTDGETWDASSESFVTTFDIGDEALTQMGQVGGLGNGEQIYAVRFMGAVAYVVTFLQVDPLYTVDLSDPSNPEVVGELKIPGFSSYLHPLEGGYLIGVGQEATLEGQILGAAVSLFDVRDPAEPTLVAKEELGTWWTEAEHDHHAFLYWPARKLLVLPRWMEYWDDVTGEGGIEAESMVFTVDTATGFEHAADITHPLIGWENWDYNAGQRSIVVGDVLYTTSGGGVMATNLDGYGQVGWLEFE
jgi:hypothetical protein